MKIKITLFLFVLSSFVLFQRSPALAQLSDEVREHREKMIEERLRDIEEQQILEKKPKTADDVLQMLKEKAEIRLKEKRRKQLLQTKVSAGLTYGYQSNPQSLQNDTEKGDFVLEDNASIKWTPTFTPRLSADIGYSFYDQNFSQQESIDSEDHTIGGTLKYYTFKSGKLVLEPSLKYEWLVYPFDK